MIREPIPGKRAIVTAVGKTRWLWLSNRAACVRRDGAWSAPYTDGATLHECLTREYHAHRILRIICTPKELK